MINKATTDNVRLHVTESERPRKQELRVNAENVLKSLTPSAFTERIETWTKMKLLSKSDLLKTKDYNDMQILLFQMENGILLRSFVFQENILEITAKLSTLNSIYEVSNYVVKNQNIKGLDEIFLNIDSKSEIKKIEKDMSKTDLFKPQTTMKIGEIKSLISTGSRLVTFLGKIVAVREDLYGKVARLRRQVTVLDGSGAIEVVFWGVDSRKYQDGSIIKVSHGFIEYFQDSVYVICDFCTTIADPELGESSRIRKEVENIPYIPPAITETIRVQYVSEILKPAAVPAFLIFHGSIDKIKMHDVVYRTCYEERHRKKLRKIGEKYFCPQCNRKYPLKGTVGQYCLKFTLKDVSGECLVTAFNTVVEEELFEMTANDFDKYSSNAKNKFMRNVLKGGESFGFKIKVTQDESAYGDGIERVVKKIWQ